MPLKPKVVFDTNVFISAIIFGGPPKICLEMVRQNEIELYVSKPILFELAKKLEEKFNWKEEEVNELIIGISKFSTLVNPKRKLNLIKADPTDNRILEAAHEAGADYIISGDKKHILPLKKVNKTKIISASEFLKLKTTP